MGTSAQQGMRTVLVGGWLRVGVSRWVCHASAGVHRCLQAGFPLVCQAVAVRGGCVVLGIACVSAWAGRSTAKHLHFSHVMEGSARQAQESTCRSPLGSALLLPPLPCSQPRGSTRETLAPGPSSATSGWTPCRSSDTAPWGGERCHGQKETALRLCLQVSKLPESSKIPAIAKYLPCKALLLYLSCTCPLQPACLIPGQVRLQFSRG